MADNSSRDDRGADYDNRGSAEAAARAGNDRWYAERTIATGVRAINVRRRNTVVTMGVYEDARDGWAQLRQAQQT